METYSATEIFVKFILPPVLYTLHGWVATFMAIGALFRPYEAWYWPGTKWQIPCTPGIFPKRRSKLAKAVAGTITDTLLTTEDVKRQVETLVTKQNIYLAVDGFIEAVLKEFRDTDKLHRLAHDLSELSPALLQQYVVSLVEATEKGSDKRVAVMLEKLFDYVVVPYRIPKEQAEDLAQRILENVLGASQVRNFLIGILSPQNIGALDDSIQAHANVPMKLLARLINVKNVCNETRKFLEHEPEQANKVIVDLLSRFEIKEQIALKIAMFDMRSMPLQSVANLRKNMVSFIESFLMEHKSDILLGVEKIQGEAMGTVQAAIIKFNPGSLPASWVEKAKREIADFIYSYLKRELGELLEKAIPALGAYGMIATKIEQFSSAQLEAVVMRICRKELKWLEFLGAFIGFWLGLIQVFINLCPIPKGLP